MKTILSTAVLLTCCISAFSQPCIPNAPTGNAGIHPPPDSIPCIERNVPYDFTMQLENFDTVAVSGFTFSFSVDSIHINDIVNLPCGINWQASSLTILKGETACIRVFGTTNEEVGQYPLRVYVTIYVNISGNPNQVSGELSDLARQLAAVGGVSYNYKYVSRVINAGDPCPPRDTTSVRTVGNSDVSISVSCAGAGIVLQATPGMASYSWSTGDITSSASVTSTGNYSVTVTDLYGCPGIASENLNASSLSADICIVGIDSATGKNIIVWEKPATAAIDSYVIYRETNQADIYAPIGIQAFNAFSIFIDHQSVPEQISNKYKLGIKDTCGFNTIGTNYHKTIHLSINQGVGNIWNLNWNHYEGFAFSSYNIYRGISSGNLSLLTSIASNVDSYTDVSPPAGSVVYYQIEVINPGSCNPSAKMNNYSSSRSNIVSTPFVGIDGLRGNNVLRMEPNPFMSFMTITIPESSDGPFELKIFSTAGKQLWNETGIRGNSFTLFRNSLPQGLYYVELRGKSTTYRGKIIAAL